MAFLAVDKRSDFPHSDFEKLIKYTFAFKFNCI